MGNESAPNYIKEVNRILHEEIIKLLALDLGYGTTKICFEKPDGSGLTTSVIQSCLSIPCQVGGVATGLKTSIRPDLIRTLEQQFYVGARAWQWGTPINNMDFSALYSIDRWFLFYAAFSKVKVPGTYIIETLIFLAPIQALKEEKEFDALKVGLAALKGIHEFDTPKGHYLLVIKKIKLHAQPSGAYGDWLFNNSDQVRENGWNANCAIADCGMNTLDLFQVKGLEVDPVLAGGDKVGLRRLYELLPTTGTNIQEFSEELRLGKIKPSKAILGTWLGQILNTIDHTWPDLKGFSVVILTGGGALVLRDMLRMAIYRKKALPHFPENPITSNVTGIYRLERYVH